MGNVLHLTKLDLLEHLDKVGFVLLTCFLCGRVYKSWCVVYLMQRYSSYRTVWKWKSFSIKGTLLSIQSFPIPLLLENKMLLGDKEEAGYS